MPANEDKMIVMRFVFFSVIASHIVPAKPSVIYSDAVVTPTGTGPYQAGDTIDFDFEVTMNFTETIYELMVKFAETPTSSLKLKFSSLTASYYKLDGSQWDYIGPETAASGSNLWSRVIMRSSQSEDCRIVGNVVTEIRGELCEDTCYAKENGNCDDGGPGATTFNCNYGNDCTDCGKRYTVGPGQQLLLEMAIRTKSGSFEPFVTQASYLSPPIAVTSVWFDMFATHPITAGGAAYVHIGEIQTLNFAIAFPRVSAQPWTMEIDAPIVNGCAVASIADISIAAIGQNVPCPLDTAAADLIACNTALSTAVNYTMTTPGREINRAAINFPEYFTITGGSVDDDNNRITFQIGFRLEDHSALTNGSDFTFEAGVLLENGSFVLVSQVSLFALADPDRTPNVDFNASLMNASYVTYTRGDQISVMLTIEHQEGSGAYAHDVIINIMTPISVVYESFTWNSDTMQAEPFAEQVNNMTRIRVDTVKFSEEMNVIVTFEIDPNEVLGSGTHVFVGVFEAIYKGTRNSAAYTSMLNDMKAVTFTYTTPACKTGQSRYGSSCYLSSDSTTATWQESADACAERGGHLVIIDGLDENEHVNLMATQLAGEIWIGASEWTDNSGNRVYRWLDDTYLQYNRWAPGEPKTGSGDGWKCALLDNGGWTSGDCAVSHHYICEIPDSETIIPRNTPQRQRNEPLSDYQPRLYMSSGGIQGEPWFIVCDNIIPGAHGMCSKVPTNNSMQALGPRVSNVMGWNSYSMEYYGIARDSSSYVVSGNHGRTWYSVSEEFWNEAMLQESFHSETAIPLDDPANIPSEKIVWLCSTC